MLAGLERWLEGREFVATLEFTVADILVAHVLTGVQEGPMAQACPRVIAYRDRCLARPAWKRALEKYMARVQEA